MTPLQTRLKKLFDKTVPFTVPDNGRKLIVELLPWVNGVLGIFGLLSAWWLWGAANSARTIFNAATNSEFYNEIYNSPNVGINLGFVFWISLVLLVVASVMMLASVTGLRERSLRKGWNLAFYAVLLNFAYGVSYLFSGIDGAFGQFVWTLVTTTLGLFVLFQVHGMYKDKSAG